MKLYVLDALLCLWFQHFSHQNKHHLVQFFTFLKSPPTSRQDVGGLIQLQRTTLSGQDPSFQTWPWQLVDAFPFILAVPCKNAYICWYIHIFDPWHSDADLVTCSPGTLQEVQYNQEWTGSSLTTTGYDLSEDHTDTSGAITHSRTASATGSSLNTTIFFPKLWITLTRRWRNNWWDIKTWPAETTCHTPTLGYQWGPGSSMKTPLSWTPLRYLNWQPWQPLGNWNKNL